MRISSPLGRWTVQSPSFSGTSALRSLGLPNVPRIITSWFPRRAPKVLKSRGSTPSDIRCCPAGAPRGMLPAGEMWSVVTESPRMVRIRPPRMSSIGCGSRGMSWKKGTSWMYVELGSHAYWSSADSAGAPQPPSPEKTLP